MSVFSLVVVVNVTTIRINGTRSYKQTKLKTRYRFGSSRVVFLFLCFFRLNNRRVLKRYTRPTIRRDVARDRDRTVARWTVFEFRLKYRKTSEIESPKCRAIICREPLSRFHECRLRICIFLSVHTNKNENKKTLTTQYSKRVRASVVAQTSNVIMYTARRQNRIVKNVFSLFRSLCLSLKRERKKNEKKLKIPTPTVLSSVRVHL